MKQRAWLTFFWVMYFVLLGMFLMFLFSCQAPAPKVVVLSAPPQVQPSPKADPTDPNKPPFDNSFQSRAAFLGVVYGVLHKVGIKELDVPSPKTRADLLYHETPELKRYFLVGYHAGEIMTTLLLKEASHRKKTIQKLSRVSR